MLQVHHSPKIPLTMELQLVQEAGHTCVTNSWPSVSSKALLHKRCCVTRAGAYNQTTCACATDANGFAKQKLNIGNQP